MAGERSLGRGDTAKVMAGDQPDDDVALVRAAQARAEEFAALYERYRVPVYCYLRARVPTDDEAADLTQQVFLRAFGALPGYEVRGVPFAAWLFRIARNAAADAHRRHRVAASWDALPQALRTDDASALEYQLLRGEALSRLGLLLAELSPEERELLALRFAANLRIREIAQVIGKSEEAVKKQLSRLLHALKERYGDE